jgi:hypothetical protein
MHFHPAVSRPLQFSIDFSRLVDFYREFNELLQGFAGWLMDWFFSWIAFWGGDLVFGVFKDISWFGYLKNSN